MKLLLISDKSWQEIIMNFITELLSNKKKNQIYDSILMIINHYTKMTRYISINIILKTHELEDLFINELFFHETDVLIKIVLNKDFLFISDYWLELYYYLKIKQQLNIAFYSQTDEQIEYQNQILKHYLHCYCDNRQSNWILLLLFAEFTYNHFKHVLIEMSSFFTYAEYKSKLYFETEDK